MRTFSFGGGVQSMAVLVLTAQGRLQYDHFLFANVGEDSENPDTLRYLDEVVIPYTWQHAIKLHELARANRTLYSDLLRDSKSINIPVRMANGAPGNRNCTANWKIKVIAKWLKQQGATQEVPAVTGLGISTDEWQRARTDSGIAWQVLEYPLLDLRLSRHDCVRIIKEAGLPVPPKSSCWFCPFKKHNDWLELRRTKPELFDKAVKLEKRINEKRTALGRDAVTLHPSMRLLEQAVGEQYALFEDEACESGYCMT